MSTPSPAGGMGGKGVLIGIGAGCGCLSLVGAVLLLLLVLGTVSRTAPPAGPPQRPPEAQGPSPAQRGQGGPEGQPQPPAGGTALQVLLTTAKLDDNRHVIVETDVFGTQDHVGVIARWQAIPQTINLQTVWLKFDGDHVVPLNQPRTASLGPQDQGKAELYWIAQLPPGNYAFLVFLPGEGDQIHVVAIRKFVVQ